MNDILCMKKIKDNKKSSSHKLKKILIITFSIIISVVVVVILSASIITKYLVEKYDVEYTGRQITMDWAYTNPFTGYVHLSGLKIYEQKNDSVFISLDGVSANFALRKLFSKTYEISELTLDHPRILIIQQKKIFNYDDLIKKFTSTDSTDTIKKAPVHFNILNIKVNDGEIYYWEKTIPITYFIKNVDFDSPGMRWNVDSVESKFSFATGIGKGDVEGEISVNIDSLNYRLGVIIKKFDLNILEQYLKELTNYGSFSANINAAIKATGNFNDAEDITARGMLVINDFHFGKNPQDDYASFDKLVLAVNDLSPKKHKYFCDSVSLSRPYLKYEQYDYLDNIEMMFGKGGSTAAAVNSDPAKFNLILEIGDYIKMLSKNFFQSDYKIKRIAVYNGELEFNDYSISEKFAMDLKPISVFADSINKNNSRVNAFFNSGVNPYGNLSVALSINPKDSGDYDMFYNLQKLPVSMFNPYTITYTSYPLDRGTMEFKGNWNVRNGIIQSVNHLIIIDPRVTKRLKNKNAKWIPMPLIMTFVRETGNIIDYEIPITGNLKDPKFHLNDVLIDLFQNIFIKPVTTPYRMLVRNTETEIEKSLTVKWEMRHSSLLSSQEKFIKKMVDFLVENPKAYIAVYPQQYAIKEKEYILLYEAKKKYFLALNNKNNQSFNKTDSIKVDKMSVKDSLFVLYLNKHVYNSLVFTIQEKCAWLINAYVINAKFEQLNKERENAFISYFKEKGVEKQVVIYNDQNVIPYNGFSYYKIIYKGEFPESIIKAYQEINELNDQEMRNKYKKDRWNIQL